MTKIDLVFTLLFVKGVDYNAMTEEEQIALAIQMSMNEANPQSAPAMEGDTKNMDAKPTEMETDVS